MGCGRGQGSCRARAPRWRASTWHARRRRRACRLPFAPEMQRYRLQQDEAQGGGETKWQFSSDSHRRERSNSTGGADSTPMKSMLVTDSSPASITETREAVQEQVAQCENDK
eukprot:scaffold70296_cov57-Phaeocystis_antarctica.AAC.1